MTSHKQTLGEDIAFMRALAEEGRSRPLIGGSILLGSGVLYGTASLLVWAASTYGFMNPGTATPNNQAERVSAAATNQAEP